MITILPSGRLGNNLFQFAFGLSMKEKLKTDFIFDSGLLEKYFELNGYNNYFARRIRFIKYLFSLKFNNWQTIDLNIDQPPATVIGKVKDHHIIYGYFQSADYFDGIHNLVQKNFKVKRRYVDDFELKYGALFKKPTVCVAIRLTDYSTWKIDEIDGNTPELSLNYFSDVLNLIDDLDQKQIILISDDIAGAKAALGYKDAVDISNEIDQIMALSMADELIISNSTFHWWGAWLNNKPNKVVYAPKYWLGHKVKREYPQNIIPANWIQMEVNQE